MTNAVKCFEVVLVKQRDLGVALKVLKLPPEGAASPLSLVCEMSRVSGGRAGGWRQGRLQSSW